jgi:uncharacterized membrane protein
MIGLIIAFILATLSFVSYLCWYANTLNPTLNIFILLLSVCKFAIICIGALIGIALLFLGLIYN